MSSFPTASAMKCAVEVCVSPQLKREILCASGSEYDLRVLNLRTRQSHTTQYDRKQEWNKVVKETAKATLNNPTFKNLCVPDEVQEQIMVFVIPFGMRMLTWAVYHEMTIGFSRECSIKALRSSVFTDQGIIDNKKAAEELMKDESLSIQQRFKLACLYCSDSEISAFYEKMFQKDMEIFHISLSGIMKFWSSCLEGKMGEELREKNLAEYRFEKAVKSGSKVAVEYCLTGDETPMGTVVDAAVEVVRLSKRNDNLDWIVFRDRKYYGNVTSWVPSAYYVDILCLLLSEMREDQRIEFLKKDIEGVKYREVTYEYPERSRVLECFLKYPYQVHFMNTAELMWEFLPENNYAVLLLKICDKIEIRNERNREYGEAECYDYRGLLQEFWKRSPERYRRYVLNNRPITFVAEEVVMLKAGEGLVVKILALQNFKPEDWKFIGLILDEATPIERKNIISGEVRSSCTRLLQEERWDILNAFLLNCFPSDEKKICFKKELICSRSAQLVLIEFLKSSKWNAVELFTNWSALSEREVNEFKRGVICSFDGQIALKDLVLYKDAMKVADEILKWCLSSEDEIKTCKKNLIFSDNGMTDCADLLIRDKTELLNKFIKWCLSSEEEIEKIKRSLAHRMTPFVCKILISNNSEDEMGEVESSKWERANKIFLGCLSSQDEVSAFKKTELFKGLGVDIHFNMIKSRKYEEAKKLFHWLGLSAEEITELKKRTVYSYANEMMFRARLWRGMSANRDASAEIEAFLLSCLTDRKAVVEFKDEFSQSFVEREMCKDGEGILKMFNSAMEHLIDQKKGAVKRKFETLSP